MAGASGVAQDCKTSGIPLRRGDSLTGIELAWMWSVSYPNSPLTWGIPTSHTPIGTSRLIRSCSSLRRSSCVVGDQEEGNEQLKPAVAHSTLLHRPPTRTTRRQSSHNCGLPRRVSHVVPVRRVGLEASTVRSAH